MQLINSTKDLRVLYCGATEYYAFKTMLSFALPKMTEEYNAMRAHEELYLKRCRKLYNEEMVSYDQRMIEYKHLSWWKRMRTDRPWQPEKPPVEMKGAAEFSILLIFARNLEEHVREFEVCPHLFQFVDRDARLTKVIKWSSSLYTPNKPPVSIEGLDD